MLLRKSSDSTTPLPSFLGRPLCYKGIGNFKGTVLASSSREILSSPLRYDLIYYSCLGERERELKWKKKSIIDILICNFVMNRKR